MRLSIIFVLISYLSFSQTKEFAIKDIGIEKNLQLFENNTFVLKSVIWGCEGPDYYYSEYKGLYNINDDNTLKLKPLKVLDKEGLISEDFSIKTIEIKDKSSETDYQADKYKIKTEYKILIFSNFDILIALETFENEFDQESDLIKFSNFLNSSKEFNEEEFRFINWNFFSTEINEFPIIKKELLKSASIINQSTILKKPLIAEITSVKENILKNKNYDKRVDNKDAKFITEQYIEINLGIKDGVFVGMLFFPISDNECAIDGLQIEKVSENKSYFRTEKLLDDGFCDPNLYKLNKKLSTEIK